MNFNLAEEIRKMLELMDKSPRVNRFIWTFTIMAFILALFFLLPDVINAIAQYQQMTGKS